MLYPGPINFSSVFGLKGNPVNHSMTCVEVHPLVRFFSILNNEDKLIMSSLNSYNQILDEFIIGI